MCRNCSSTETTDSCSFLLKTTGSSHCSLSQSQYTVRQPFHCVFFWGREFWLSMKTLLLLLTNSPYAIIFCFCLFIYFRCSEFHVNNFTIINFNSPSAFCLSFVFWPIQTTTANFLGFIDSNLGKCTDQVTLRTHI